MHFLSIQFGKKHHTDKYNCYAEVLSFIKLLTHDDPGEEYGEYKIGGNKGIGEERIQGNPQVCRHCSQTIQPGTGYPAVFGECEWIIQLSSFYNQYNIGKTSYNPAYQIIDEYIIGGAAYFLQNIIGHHRIGGIAQC